MHDDSVNCAVLYHDFSQSHSPLPVDSSYFNCTSPHSPAMSGKPVSHDSHPPHGHPENQGPSEQNVDRASTASHPPSTKPDPTTTAPHPKLNPHGAKGVQSSSSSSGPAELADLKVRLRNALRQYPDFPSKGILFEDIMPIFSSPKLHSDLIKALELEVRAKFDKVPDVIVGLESRGFLFGPSLALRLDAGFVPVRKQGKLPGKLETEGYEKEYGTDFFQIQSDAIAKGQTVLVVDDIMATGTLLRPILTRLVSKLTLSQVAPQLLVETSLRRSVVRSWATCSSWSSSSCTEETSSMPLSSLCSAVRTPRAARRRCPLDRPRSLPRMSRAYKTPVVLPPASSPRGRGREP